VSRSAWPPIFGQSFRITASVTTRKGERDGVLVAAGSLFGGWSFYLEDGRPVAHEAVSQKPEDQFRVAARKAVPQGDATVRFEFKQDPGMPGSGGTLQIDINGEEVAQGRIDRTILLPAGIGETFDVGLDTGARVTDDYAGEGAFQGQIHKVVVEVAPPGAPGPHGGTQSVSAPDRPAGQEGAPLE
jgi:arylsulfatase